MQEIPVEAARKVLGDLATGIANGGEPVIITKNGMPAAALIHCAQLHYLPTPADLYANALAAREVAAERGYYAAAIRVLDQRIAQLRQEAVTAGATARQERLDAAQARLAAEDDDSLQPKAQ